MDGQNSELVSLTV